MGGGIRGGAYVLYIIMIVVAFIPLIVAGVYLIRAILPRNWEFAPCEPDRIRELCKVTKDGGSWVAKEDLCSNLDEAVLPVVVGELTDAVAYNRSQNIARYALVERSLLWVVIAVCALGALGLVHAVIFMLTSSSPD